MFIDDLRNDFYNVLLGNRVLLLVHYDVDAICTCKILQGLFKCDNISYTLVPVGGISELKSAYEENCKEVKYVVLVNCGGTIDLVDILQPEEDVVFFVLDTHKPTDVCNVYSDGQVRLLYKDSDEDIPNFDDIFRDDEDENEEEEPIEGGLDGLEAAVKRRREKKLWEERRNEIMFNYTQFSYFGKPSACVAAELAWRMSRCGRASCWAAAVAVTGHATLGRPPAAVLLDADLLQRCVASDHAEDATVYRPAKISLEKDAWLPLYRMWSVEAALSVAPLIAPYLKLHTAAGATRLRQLLADMGFPLQQARQAYRSMDVELRRALITSLEAAAPKHKLPVPTRATFLLHRPHAPTVAALDVVYAIMGLIEHDSIPRAEGFQLSLSALEVECCGAGLMEGVAAAKRSLTATAAALHATLAARQLHVAGPFAYFLLQEGTPESSLLSGPLWLGEAARWAAKVAGRPILASASGSVCLLLGVPANQHESRNLFGAAFEQAATKSGVTVSLDYMDSSVIKLPLTQRAQFLDALTALLA